VVQVDTKVLLGRIGIEIERRRKRGYTEDQYQREWDQTHTGLDGLAQCEASPDR
jgi:hypothetical protein